MPLTHPLPLARAARHLHNGLPKLWGRRGFSQIKQRWAVPPLLVGGVLLARAAGFEFRAAPILAIALASLLYNALFAWVYARWWRRLEADPALDRAVVIVEILADYSAILLLLHFTGGAANPLAFFLLIHIVLGAIQFSAGTAFLIAGLASAGLWGLLLDEMQGRLLAQPVAFRGEPLHLIDRPLHSAFLLLVLTATFFLVAALVSRIMRQLHRGVDELGAATEQLSELNRELNGLYTMVCAIGAERRLAPILETVTRELARVVQVPAVSVKLLSEDGQTLRYVAAHGLPEDLVRDTVIELDRSPLNRRVVEGETLVQGRIGGDDELQLGDELAALGLRSAVFAPLKVEERVIGTLGVYAHAAGRFGDRDSEFLELASRLVALAIENARANEAIETLMRDRIQFMLKVAHNLRAPLSAGLGMLELVRLGRLGEVTAEQAALLQRLDDRLRALDRAIGQLLTIAKARDFSREIPDVVVDLEELAATTERTFRAEAEAKRLGFTVRVEPDLPGVESGVDLLKELMENLVSNAIKYTPEGGEVEVRFEGAGPAEVRIVVRDTGIGIPEKEQGKLFAEFYRASNAKKHSPAGTGLGLALVKQTVERHHGTIALESAEGRGTRVTIEIPVHRVGKPAPPPEALVEENA